MRRDPWRAKPQGPTGTWVKAEGGKGGENDVGYDGRRKHAARGAERAVEAGGGWVWETPRWTELRVRKGGGEGV